MNSAHERASGAHEALGYWIVDNVRYHRDAPGRKLATLSISDVHNIRRARPHDRKSLAARKGHESGEARIALEAGQQEEIDRHSLEKSLEKFNLEDSDRRDTFLEGRVATSFIKYTDEET